MFGILFDLDGTLVDSDPIHFEAWQKILVEKIPEQPPIDRAFFDKHISGKRVGKSFSSPTTVSFRSIECGYYTRIIRPIIRRGTGKCCG